MAQAFAYQSMNASGYRKMLDAFEHIPVGRYFQDGPQAFEQEKWVAAGMASQLLGCSAGGFLPQYPPGQLDNFRQGKLREQEMSEIRRLARPVEEYLKVRVVILTAQRHHQ